MTAKPNAGDSKPVPPDVHDHVNMARSMLSRALQALDAPLTEASIQTAVGRAGGAFRRLQRAANALKHTKSEG